MPAESESGNCTGIYHNIIHKYKKETNIVFGNLMKKNKEALENIVTTGKKMTAEGPRKTEECWMVSGGGTAEMLPMSLKSYTFKSFLYAIFVDSKCPLSFRK